MTALHRRGVCPGLSAPIPTGDGLLVRFMPAEVIPLDTFVKFCEAAHQHGNGTVEISARGSLQVRGLTPRSAPLFASAVTELGLIAQEGVPVIAGPLTHDADDMIDVASTAAELRRVLGNTRLGLSAKVSVVVDGNGPLHLDALPADVRLRAVGSAQRPRFYVGLGGDGASASWLGSVAPEDVVGVVVGLLTVIAAHGPAARAADVLRSEGVGAFRFASAAFTAPPLGPAERMPAEVLGVHSTRDGTIAVGIGLAFGHTQAETLADLVRVAAAADARAVRPAPDRALLLLGVAATDAAGLKAAAEQLGFVTQADDPRRRIAACPGAPACASGLIPARALASALTPSLTPVVRPERNGIVVHISGCQKGCAHPTPAALTLVGTPNGCGIVHSGSARATPHRYVDPANLGAEISRFAAKTREAAHG